MSVNIFLDATQFIEMFRAGHLALSRAVPSINSLNVFPVPDGDTGTNMELSLLSGLRAMESARASDLHAVAEALATGLLMGARGNSGVILSQLLRGFTQVSYGIHGLDVQNFANALHEGVDIAYRAVAKPVEGTILTVAREAAAVGRKRVRSNQPIAEWLQYVVTAARDTLERTPELLPVLRQAGVVDSGGQGLVTVFEGWLSWLRGETFVGALPALPMTSAQLDHLCEVASHRNTAGSAEFGYCTEVLLRVKADDARTTQERLQGKLSMYGESLLVVSSGEFVKAHVHTLNPGRVLEDALQYGPLVKIKIENMTEQVEHVLRESAPNQMESNEAAGAVMTAGKLGISTALVAVAVGVGIEETFHSLGVDKVAGGGQTMNPSTEELMQAAREACAQTGAVSVIILPNNQNVEMAAEQAAQLSDGTVAVAKTKNILEGMAAVLAFRTDRDVGENVAAMEQAARATISGAVVQAVRDTVFQDITVQSGQYLAFEGGTLKRACSTRVAAFRAVVEEIWHDDAELLTVFYGGAVPAAEREQIDAIIVDFPGLEMEFRYGGQPVYEYLISLE